ncbi:hypothetical protein [Caulobacter hibisci]|uniref:Rad50/SbcC-type AAA domain-containing protein n=1 Tax=Caulobacter hibisci TaxID=2035993 RepID=A0ABS0T138_9CAUL|nr:hypothetical protein [Caulobacter hibisci]MBI1685394.1 hypothetical protein [Caulobacter hibisci]
MFQVRRVVVRGKGVPDAELTFKPGANILAGVSDTGKSYLVQCLDFIFGADKIKRFPLSEPYSHLFVQFANDDEEPLTLSRALSGGDLTVTPWEIDGVRPTNQSPSTVVPRRRGRSKADDVTSVLFPFADLPEANLRKNRYGELQRLTFRHWMPSMLVDEVAVIDARSPVRGPEGFDTTINERAFAFSLAGRDDGEVVSAERNDVVVARLNAKLAVIDNLLEPLDARLKVSDGETEETIEKVEGAIARLSTLMDDNAQAHAALQIEREVALGRQLKAEGQIMAIDELLARYRLLDGRYGSDLDRLDFIAEGAHYLDALQSVACPLCDQAMDAHQHAEADNAEVQTAARAEAAKILALRQDLTVTIQDVEARRVYQVGVRDEARTTITRVDAQVRGLMNVDLRDADSRLSRLVERRVVLEAARNDKEQAVSLRTLRQSIEAEANRPRATARKWEALPSSGVHDLCTEIEKVLQDWSWPGRGKVTFDQNVYDIEVDGQPRQSHGKGVRGVLYSAFVIGLLNYCRARGRPHAGLVVIDSPLTAFSKQKNLAPGSPLEVGVSDGVEAKFWNSLTRIGPEVQVIVIENKPPPPSVAGAVAFTWFAGEFATDGERAGFFPV